MLIVLVAATMVLQTPPAAPGTGNTPDKDFLATKTFRCRFVDGEGRAYRSGKSEDLRGGEIGNEIVIDELKYKEGTARIAGSARGDYALLSDGPMAVTLFETAQWGGMVMTTVFKTALEPQVFLAAVSRHLIPKSGDVIATQYYGTCKGTQSAASPGRTGYAYSASRPFLSLQRTCRSPGRSRIKVFRSSSDGPI